MLVEVDTACLEDGANADALKTLARRRTIEMIDFILSMILLWIGIKYEMCRDVVMVFLQWFDRLRLFSLACCLCRFKICHSHAVLFIARVRKCECPKLTGGS